MSTIDSWRAAVLRTPGTCLEFVEVMRPRLSPGQVLVKLYFSGVCRSQLLEVRGQRGVDAWLPHMLGHEGVGVVIEVGANVSKVAVGDQVVVGWIKGDGIESSAPVYTAIDGERINAGKVTTFSECTVVSENRVYHRPYQIDLRTAVLFGCALLTGAGMVLNQVRPELGESLLINGLGGVGFAALVATQGLGVTVIASDPDPLKRQLALGLGASLVADPLGASLKEQVRQHFPNGVDAAIDATGTTIGIEDAFDCLRPERGRLIFASHPPNGERIRLNPHDLIMGRTIHGSWGGACNPDQDIPRLSEAIANSGTDLDFMVPRTYSMDELNQALDDLELGRAMRPIIDLQGPAR